VQRRDGTTVGPAGLPCCTLRIPKFHDNLNTSGIFQGAESPFGE
jgi:hypothetical protein